MGQAAAGVRTICCARVRPCESTVGRVALCCVLWAVSRVVGQARQGVRRTLVRRLCRVTERASTVVVTAGAHYLYAVNPRRLAWRLSWLCAEPQQVPCRHVSVGAQAANRARFDTANSASRCSRLGQSVFYTTFTVESVFQYAVTPRSKCASVLIYCNAFVKVLIHDNVSLKSRDSRLRESGPRLAPSNVRFNFR